MLFVTVHFHKNKIKEVLEGVLTEYENNIALGRSNYQENNKNGKRELNRSSPHTSE